MWRNPFILRHPKPEPFLAPTPSQAALILSGHAAYRARVKAKARQLRADAGLPAHEALA